MREKEQETGSAPAALRRRRLWTYAAVAVGVSVAALVVISLLTMDRNTFKAISHIEVFSFVIVLVLVVGRWVGELFRYKLIIRASGNTLPMRSISRSVLGGAFAGAITPYRSASFPAQVFFLSRYGLSGGEATAISLTGGAISLLVMTVAMPVVLILSASKIHMSLGIRTILVGVAVMGFFAFMFAVYSMRDPSRISRILGRIAPRRLRMKPGFQRFEERLTKGMEDFSKSLRTMLKAPKLVLVAILALTVVFWFAGACVAAFILRGLGYPQYFWQALLGQMLVSGILPFTPVPGESGVAEAAFAGVFGVFIKKNTIALVTMAWRFFMLYLPLVGLGIFFVLAANDARRIGKEREEAATPAQPELGPEPAIEDAGA